MSARNHLELTIKVEAESSFRSLRSVLDVLGASGHVLELATQTLGDMFGSELAGRGVDLFLERRDLLLGEPILRSTDGALELIFKPGDRYLEFVSAIARNVDVSCDVDAHDWPILSLASGDLSVAEGGRESISPAGGVRA